MMGMGFAKGLHDHGVQGVWLIIGIVALMVIRRFAVHNAVHGEPPPMPGSKRPEHTRFDDEMEERARRRRDRGR